MVIWMSYLNSVFVLISQDLWARGSLYPENKMLQWIHMPYQVLNYFLKNISRKVVIKSDSSVYYII